MGGGIFRNAGTLTLKNTIVAGNLDGAASDGDDVNGALDAASSYNLIGVDTGISGVNNGINGNQIGTFEAPVNPRLNPLANNGGPTQTHLLRPDSPGHSPQGGEL